MTTPRIEWARLSQDELADVLEQARREGARRIKQLMQLIGVQQSKGPGRKAADPLDDLIAEDSSETEDAAAADSSLS